MHIVDSRFDGRKFVADHPGLDDTDLASAVLEPAEVSTLIYPEKLTTHGAIRAIGECAFLEARARRKEAARMRDDEDNGNDEDNENEKEWCLSVDEAAEISRARLKRDQARMALLGLFERGEKLKPEASGPLLNYGS